ncbi:putative serine dehydratase domain-containing protein [Talaromyces proteolyticus]|uniref:D-serine dehydratase n=1 Tax=Talaromyces proteolyticus TaxID=1131652 RepID=A0AAD4PW73_9EURO|nr:putative serine dehydratase domain-containing protein [Talaromyces proteolyticus]KAH8691597.1 putative serine dehydratase domain-containing protein [Talaromyces proteolyticus]
MESLKLPQEETIKRFFIGKDIADVPKPAVVLDRAIIKRNCDRMLQAVKSLDVGFRTHVKTHKTQEVAQLQVGEENTDANFVVSTIQEIDHLLPLFKKLKNRGRMVNVLYGIPLVPSKVTRLATLAKELGEKSITVMIDHPDQLSYLSKFHNIAKFPAYVFLKVDTGYHRAGLPPTALNKDGLLEKLAEAEKSGLARFLGVYSHSSLSYTATTSEEAMTHLTKEIVGCNEAVKHNLDLLPRNRELIISVGATPQVLSCQNLLSDSNSSSSPEAETLKALLRDPLDGAAQVKIELHAGVYPILDMQQISTNAITPGRLEDDIAISVIAEVSSVYNNGERSKPEALVAAGTLALGREPCASYPGWGIISSWRRASAAASRLIVERISQEHAIISWENSTGQSSTEIPLQIGQAVRIYPNHACVTGAMYGWYLVVDSSLDTDSAKIIDVWVRAKGHNSTF